MATAWRFFICLGAIGNVIGCVFKVQILLRVVGVDHRLDVLQMALNAASVGGYIGYWLYNN